MFPLINKRTAVALLVSAVLASPAVEIYAQKNKGKKAQTAAGKSSSAAVKKESVNEVKRQQGAVQKEIASTRAQIKENEQAVKKGLADLNVLQGEIAEGKKKLEDASRQVKDLSEKITTSPAPTTSRPPKNSGAHSSSPTTTKTTPKTSASNSTAAPTSFSTATAPTYTSTDACSPSS